MGAVPPFRLWGSDHLAVLGLILVGAMALVAAPRRVGWNDRRLRRGIAALLVANEVIAWAVAAAQGRARVPLQLCDAALFLTVWALWSARPAVSELSYFWGIGGGLQAVLTPDVRFGFPNYWWVTFFVTHGGIVLSAVYLAVTGRVAPTPRSVWRVWGLANLYAASAGVANWAFGTNYGYLAHKPMQPSVLDYCGSWPWYILVMEVVALGVLFLAYVPFIQPRKG